MTSLRSTKSALFSVLIVLAGWVQRCDADTTITLSHVLRFGAVTTHFSSVDDPTGSYAATADPNVFTGTFTHLAGTWINGTSFGAGLELHVTVNATTGDATFVSATHDGDTAFVPVTFDDPEAAWYDHHGVRVKRVDLTLGVNGISATARMYFPAGFGVATPHDVAPSGTAKPSKKLWSYVCSPAGTVLTSDGKLADADYSFDALAVLTGHQAAPPEVTFSKIYCHHDKLPCWFVTTEFTWHSTTGQFTFAPGSYKWERMEEMAAFISVLPQIPSFTDLRPSNDQIFQGVSNSLTSNYAIQSTNGVAMLSATVPFGGSFCNPHFPAHAILDSAGGQIVITSNVVDTTNSVITGVTEVRQRYARDPVEMKDCPSAAGEGDLVLHPAGDVLHVTKDLGLIADGTLASGQIGWDTADRGGAGNTPRFAFSTQTNFTQATWHQAGICLPGDTVLVEAYAGPGTLLLTGRDAPGVGAREERPLDENYTAPFDAHASYAGMNVRVGNEAANFMGGSVLSGIAVGYPLTTRSQYYLRQGGVSGVHEGASSGPLNLQLYGFPTTLDEFKLSFLDNINTDSFCSGSLTVPYPSGFTQAFENLQFNTRGQPTDATLPQTGNEHDLQYWGSAHFKGLSIAFVPTPLPGGCNVPPVGEGKLQMAARFPKLPSAANPFINQAVTGTLDFVSSGAIASSELTLPSDLNITVPSGGSYQLHTTAKGFFNNPGTPAPSEHTGFVSIAGDLVVPFFDAQPVHVHLLPGTGAIHVMARTDFADPDHRGVPGNLSADAYRNDSLYFPTARRQWLGLVHFDLPMRWNATDKHFDPTGQDQTRNFLIFDLKHHLKSLSGTGAEIDFGAELNGLPQLNAQRLIIDAVDKVSGGAFTKFQNSLNGAIGDAVDHATQLTDGLKAMDKLVPDRIESLAADSITPAMSLLADQYVNAALGAANGSVAQFKQFVQENANFPDPTTSVANLLHGNGGPIAGIDHQVQQTLAQVRTGLDSAIDILKRENPNDPNSRHIIFKELARRLMQNENHAAADLLGAGGDLLDQELIELEDQPFFDELEASLLSLKGDLNGLIGDITKVQDQITSPVNDFITNEPGAIPGLRAAMFQAVNNEIEALLPDDLSTLSDFKTDVLKDKVARALRDAFLASTTAAKLHEQLRNVFTEKRALLRDQLDKLIAQITTSLSEALLKAPLNGANPFNGYVAEANHMLGAFNDVFSGIGLRGHARIVGDSLAEIRLDGGLGVKPSGIDAPLEFKGWITYKNRELLGPVPDCLDVGSNPDAALDITAGTAFGSKSKGGGFLDGLHLSAEYRFVFNDHGMPLGFAGNTEFDGNLDFGLVTINHASLATNISENNQFMVAGVKGKIIQLIDADAKLFIGHTCDLGRLGVWDPYLGRALQANGFAGTSQSADVFGTVFNVVGEVSLSKILRLEASRKIIDVGITRGQSSLRLVGPGPSFIAAESIYGTATARVLDVVNIADVQVGIAGSATVSFAARHDPLSFAVFGGARFQGPQVKLGPFSLGAPAVNLEVTGTAPSPLVLQPHLTW